MRIAITINTSWNIYNFRSGLIRAFQDVGHEVIAIAPKDDYSIKLEAMGCKFIPINIDQTGTSPWKDFMFYRQLKRVYANEQPDIILQYTIKPNIYGTLAASAVGIPVINNVSGLGTVFLTQNISSLIAKWLYRLSFRRADLVFFQNKDDQTDFNTHINIPEQKTALLPGSGIDVKKFIPTEGNIKKKEQFEFLMIGRLIEEKGVSEFMAASQKIAEEFDSVRFSLVGQLDEDHVRGIDRKSLEQWSGIDQMNYLGQLDDIRQAINQADCVVLPSYREGTPRTLLEAAAMAKPIVTTDVPGCREVVIDEKNGLLCEAKSSHSLRTKMIEIYQMNTDQRLEMGKFGRRLIEQNFDEELVISKYLRAIEEILNKKST